MSAPQDRQNRLYKEILKDFRKDVDPLLLMDYLAGCITEDDKDRVRAKLSNKGRSAAVGELLDRLRRRPNWENNLLEALQHPELKLHHLTKLFIEKCTELQIKIQDRHNCPPVPTDGSSHVLVAEKEQEKEIKTEVERVLGEFKARVDPENFLRYLENLKEQDKDAIKIKQDFEGRAAAAEELVSRLLQYKHWKNDLEKALKMPDSGFEDLGLALSKIDVAVSEFESAVMSINNQNMEEQFKMHTSKEERSSRRYIHFGNTRPATIGEQIKSGAIQIRKKSEEKTKGHQRTSCWTEKTFDKKLEQLKESENYEFRIQRLISFLNIETYNLHSNQRDRMENNDFKDIIKRVDYLDCSGLHFSDAEKQSKSFEPFSQSSVDDFLEWMTDFNKVFRKTQSPKCRLILSILFSAYAKKAMLEFKPRYLSLVIDRCLECAIENQNHILILEIVRSYLLDFDFHLCKLFKGKKRISLLINTFLTTALYIILRECPRLRQNAIRLSVCCECSKESRLVIIMLYKGSIEMKDGIPEKVMGVNLVLYNYTQPSDEARTVFNSSSASFSSSNLPVIEENVARKLFKKHSNLTLISASPYKSSGYSKGKHIIVEKHCISLLCLHKGYIPFGEREFPKQINGFEVDVQEGYCSLGSGRSIDFGGHIRRARGVNTPGNGSIGGFVDLPDGSVGLITCAHVVFSTDELNVPNTELVNYVTCRGTDFKAEFFDKNKHKFQVCGNIVDKRFPLSMNDNTIDAALIKLDPTVNEFGFPLALAGQLYSAGFDPDISPVFNGEVVTLQDPDPIHNVSSRFPDRLDSVIKYGSKSGFTIGNLYFDGAHIRFLNESLGLPDQINVVSMYNQIEIQSLPHGAFFEVGDSGAFVFCINPDKTLSCLGMAIGLTTRGSCVVTPMVRILDSFGLPHTLKPCSSFCPRNNSSGSQDPTGSQSEQQNNNASSSVDLGAILLNLQTSITSMQSSIMGVQNQQTSIQTSLQSVQAEVGNLKAQVQADVCDLKAQIQELKDEIHTNSSTGLLDINQN